MCFQLRIRYNKDFQVAIRSLYFAHKLIFQSRVCFLTFLLHLGSTWSYGTAGGARNGGVHSELLLLLLKTTVFRRQSKLIMKQKLATTKEAETFFTVIYTKQPKVLHTHTLGSTPGYKNTFFTSL